MGASQVCYRYLRKFFRVWLVIWLVIFGSIWYNMQYLSNIQENDVIFDICCIFWDIES